MNENNPNEFNYMMLSRMQGDCKYVLGYGGIGAIDKRLFDGSIDKHIDEMERIWGIFPIEEKPEWLSLEEIKGYRVKMHRLVENEKRG